MAGNEIRAGRAYIELSTKDKGLSAGLSRAKAMLGDFAKGMAIVGTAAAGAAIGGMSVAVKQFVSMGSALKDMSDRTGVSAEKLSELQYAAEQSGASLDDVEMALRHMAKAGDKRSFDQVAASIAGIKDSTERAHAAIEAWGRGGTSLIPMAADLAALRQEARDTGNVMSDEMAAKAEHTGDLLSSLWGTIKHGVAAIGALAEPFLNVAIPAIQSFSQFVFNSIGPVTAYVVQSMSAIGEAVSAVWSYIGGNTGSVMAFLVDSVSNAIAAITFAFSNWKLLAQVAMVSAELAVVQFGNQAAYFFGTFIPGWLKWFSEHWREVFTDLLHVTETVATNIWKNLADLWDAIVALFNGDGFEFKWTPLTDGFKSAIKELPKIAEREMGPLETELQNRLNGLADQMVGEVQPIKTAAKDALIKTFSALGLPAGRDGRKAVAQAAENAGMSSSSVIGSYKAAALEGGGGGNDPHTKEQRETNKLLQQHLKEMMAVRGMLKQFGLLN